MSPLSGAVVAAIRLYQRAASPLLGGHCRFQPTCSQYAIEALGKRGFVTGGLLALRRLARCHPLGGSGFDPVPERGGLRASGGAS